MSIIILYSQEIYCKINTRQFNNINNENIKKSTLMHVLTFMHVSIINRDTNNNKVLFKFDAVDIGSFLIVLNHLNIVSIDL